MRPFKREYEYFLLLCKTLNVSAAAEEAGIQQAGLSKSLMILEEQLIKPLFYRTSRGLKLTSYGEIFRDLLNNSLALWESSLEHQLKQMSEVNGTYRIGAHPIVASNMFFKFFSTLNEEYRGLNFQLELKKSSEVTKDVIDFRLDLGIVASPIQQPDLVIIKLQKEYSACWSMNQKNEKKVLYYNPETIGIVKNLKRFNEYKFVEINDYEVIASLAKSSEGVCILPSLVAHRYPGLVQVGKAFEDIDICLIYRHDSLKTRAFTEIIERIKVSFKK